MIKYIKRKLHRCGIDKCWGKSIHTIHYPHSTLKVCEKHKALYRGFIKGIINSAYGKFGRAK